MHHKTNQISKMHHKTNKNTFFKHKKCFIKYIKMHHKTNKNTQTKTNKLKIISDLNIYLFLFVSFFDEKTLKRNLRFRKSGIYLNLFFF